MSSGNRGIFSRPSSSTLAAHGDIGGRGLTSYPLDKTGDFRVRGQGIDGGVFVGEFGFREYCVDLLVAGSAEENDGMTFGPIELPAGAGSFMEGSWDKMVPSEARRGTCTKGAAGFLHPSDSARLPQWWQEFFGVHPRPR